MHQAVTFDPCPGGTGTDLGLAVVVEATVGQRCDQRHVDHGRSSGEPASTLSLPVGRLATTNWD